MAALGVAAVAALEVVRGSEDEIRPFIIEILRSELGCTGGISL